METTPSRRLMASLEHLLREAELGSVVFQQGHCSRHQLHSSVQLGLMGSTTSELPPCLRHKREVSITVGEVGLGQGLYYISQSVTCCHQRFQPVENTQPHQHSFSTIPPSPPLSLLPVSFLLITSYCSSYAMMSSQQPRNRRDSSLKLQGQRANVEIGY